LADIECWLSERKIESIRSDSGLGDDAIVDMHEEIQDLWKFFF